MRLQLGHLAADRRERHAEAAGSGREAACFHHRHQDRHRLRGDPSVLSRIREGSYPILPSFFSSDWKGLHALLAGDIRPQTQRKPPCPASRPPPRIEAAPLAAQPLLEAVKKQLGIVPNLFRLVSQQPRRARGLSRPVRRADKGSLPAPTRERIALAVAEINGCNYCLSAHTYLGKNLAKLDDAEIDRQPQRRLERPQGRCRRALRRQGRARARPCRRRRCAAPSRPPATTTPR